MRSPIRLLLLIHCAISTTAAFSMCRVLAQLAEEGSSYKEVEAVTAPEAEKLVEALAARYSEGRYQKFDSTFLRAVGANKNGEIVPGKTIEGIIVREGTTIIFRGTLLSFSHRDLLPPGATGGPMNERPSILVDVGGGNAKRIYLKANGTPYVFYPQN